MKRLVFIVEGHTEIILVDKLISPYLYSQELYLPMHAQTIITNRKQHKKGGVVSYSKFKREVRNTMSQGNVIITTLIDFYGLPSSFPEYTKDPNKIQQIEKAIHNDFDNNDDFIPYIQKHELEALMFSDIKGFEVVIDNKDSIEKIADIIEEFPNPEDINNSPSTAPSKRLKKIFNYDKTGDGELVFNTLGMEIILDKCPKFAQWIEKLKDRIRTYLK